MLKKNNATDKIFCLTLNSIKFERMTSSENNIQFFYLYRDTGNYKQFGSVIFSNAKGLALENIDQRIRESLISETYFYTRESEIPSAVFPDITDLDPTWHEYEKVALSNETPNDGRSIDEFVEMIKIKRKSYI